MSDASTATPVSDGILQQIVEKGFFNRRGSLADARAACAELIFARDLIKAQTMRIAQLNTVPKRDSDYATSTAKAQEPLA